MNNLFDKQLIEQVLIEESMQESYLDYSMSVIVGRALPDARDGLKPVHRRILYSMNELNLSHKANYKKSARIVGDVIGKYHPHGDSAVYDALVRMAQEFSMRMPLIDGQGNFGSIDGDNPAAMRYCVVGDTRVKSEKGLIKIKNIVKDSSPNSDNDVDLRVFSMNGKRVSASKFFNSGIHNIYTLETEEGFQIEGSGNHPILVLSKGGVSKKGYNGYEWIELQKISSGDTVLIDKSQVSITEKDINQRDLDLAFIIASTISNGKLSDGKIEFKTDDKNSFNKFIKSWINVFGENYKTSSEKDLKSGENIYVFLSQSDETIEEFFSFEFANLEIPDFIFENRREIQQTFLYHLLLGTDKQKSSTINYRSSSEKFIRDIQLLLLEFGVIGKIFKIDNQIEIEISGGENIETFYKNIKKIENVDEVLEQTVDDNFSNVLHQNYYFAKVKSCEITKKEFVYSIRVDSSCHSFVANGFINHNTEARMTSLSEELLKDIDKDTVDFIPNYDDSLSEPSVLPSRVPNLLLNGSSGIAVGMATNIPPHRLDELIDVHIAYLNNPNIELEELMEYLVGPDFPTGGIIFGKKGIIDAYKNGRGRIKVRAKIHIEQYRSREVIIIDELPYQVNKAKLIESIANLVKDKQIDGISEVRDESDREGIRVVIELKRDAISDIVLNNLYKSSQLQVTFGIIMLAIVNKEPKVLNLKSLIEIFISHRKSIIIRKAIFELERAKVREDVLEGLKKAVDNIDRVIKIVRSSSNDSEARESLVREFDLSQTQAKAILDMRLRRVTALEIDKIETELKELKERIGYLKSILKSKKLIEKIIQDELLEVKESFHTERKTKIVNDYDDINIEDLIPNEPMVVTITHRGYIKRVPLKQYEKQKRGGKGKTALTTYEDDFIERFFISHTHDTLMFVTNRGQLYWLKVYKIPEGSRTAKGKAVVNLINLSKDEKIMAIIPTTDFKEDKSLLFFTKKGVVKRTNLKEYSNIRSSGVKAITLAEDDTLIDAKIIKPSTNWIFLLTKKGMCIRFKVSELREIGRVAKGVNGIKFKIDGDYVCGATTVNSENDELLIVSEKGLGKRTTASEYREQSRTGKGVIAMRLTPKTGDVIGVVFVEEDKDLMCLSSIGKMIRVDMHSIRKAGRATSGVKIVNVERDDKVVSIAKCPKEDSGDRTPQGAEVID